MNARTLRALLALVLVASLALVGCTPEDDGEQTGETPAPSIKIGTLATQDALPLWVAEEKGYFEDAGLAKVEIITFQSAQESQVAFQSGAVDALMTDIIVAANLHASGTEVTIPTVMLGADTAQGRFAVVGAPGSDFASMTELKGVPVGTASATITEYILDKLAEEAGLAATDVKKEEVKKMPVRFQLLMSGQLKAASLPEPFVTLAEQGGAKIIPGGDDTKAQQNLSQTILCVNAEYAGDEVGANGIDAVLEAWDMAAADINAEPNSFRQTLVDKASLPPQLADTYAVSQYPTAQQPAAEDIQRVLDWMEEKGYLQSEITPEDMLSE